MQRQLSQQSGTLINKPLPQLNTNTLPQHTVDTESVPVFSMFVQDDGQQPTSSSRMKEDAAEESQQSATDDNPEVSRPPLYTQWNPDTGMTEVRRGYRSLIPEGKYIARTWTQAPPDPHIVRYEGVKHGYRGIVTRVHNPKTGYFEIKRSPLPSPTVSPVPGLHGAARDIKPTLSTSRTDHKLKQTIETPHVPSSTLPKTTNITGSKIIQITGSNHSKYRPQTSNITQECGNNIGEMPKTV